MSDTTPSTTTSSRVRSIWLSLAPALVALLAWALLAGFGAALRSALAETALSVSVQVLPLALGTTLCLLVALWVWWAGFGPVGAGAILGIMGGWVSFAILTVLSGTPFGIGGLVSDCGRTAVAAERYTTTIASADGFLQGLPAQYPPLYFWLWGRYAVANGLHAWEAMARWQGVALGLSILATGFLWRIALGRWQRALGATAVTAGTLLVAYSFDPCRGHESTAYLAGVPVLIWASLTVAETVRDGRLRWLPAIGWGFAVGVILTMYQLPIGFGLPPLLVLWLVWAIKGHRVRKVIGHVAIAGGAAVVAASWYLVPIVMYTFAHEPAPRPNDPVMVIGAIETPTGVVDLTNAAAVLIIVTGTLLAAWHWRSLEGQAVLTMTVGCLVIQALALWNIVKGGEPFYSYRTIVWLAVVLSAPIALFADPKGWMRRLAAAMTVRQSRLAAALAIALIGLPVVFGYWSGIHPPINPLQTQSDTAKELSVERAALAYTTPLPDCSTVPGLAGSMEPIGCYPATEIQRCITNVLGSDRYPIMLTSDDRASAFFPNFQVLPQAASATGPLDDWQGRYAWTQELAATTDPREFARTAASGPYGAVQVFVLGAKRDGTLTYQAQRLFEKESITFSRNQFAPEWWSSCQFGTRLVLVARPGVLPQ